MDLVAKIQAAVAEAEANRLCDETAAWRIALLLAKLTGTLRFHFAAEDRSLYPRLIASDDAAVAETARKFVDEMGHVGPAYMAYAARWERSAAIREDWTGFRRETAAIVAALSDRIDRENRTLYPLADRVTKGREAA